MHINWVQKKDKYLPHCPKCGELLYDFSGDKIHCYVCGSLIDKDDRLEELLKYKEKMCDETNRSR